MLVLFETPAGYAIFKVNDESKLKKVDNIFSEFESPEAANDFVKLKAFYRFTDTTEALAAASSLIESKLNSDLRRFLKKNIVSKGLTDELAVSDAKLGGLIKDKLGISCIADNKVNELMRGIRHQMTNLIDGLEESQLRAMQLGLGHTLSRYKLKFSPDKVDTMIVQAIGLLDELDKEINTYAMRLKEWYGWHFPEMVKIVNDNLQYAKCIQRLGYRSNAINCDFSDILPEEQADLLKEAAIVSMGTDISEEDLKSLNALANEVVALMEYRVQLSDYLSNRMAAIAPNLTVMVGELVGARLIAHAGSLMNLAKQPASTVQILGAEKALFRALKTKHDTPKYGLIYHASLIGQAPPKHKGKISRVLAAKTALSIRVDALGEGSGPTVAIEAREKVEQRLRQLEGGARIAASGPPAARVVDGKDVTVASQATYNPGSDFVGVGVKRKADEDAEGAPEKKKDKKEKKEKKEKKKKDKEEKKKEKKEKKKEKKEKKEKKKEKKDKESRKRSRSDSDSD